MENGIYESSIIAEIAQNYTFQVSIPNFNTIACHVLIPKSEIIQNIRHINKAGKDQEGLTCPAIEITFSTTPKTSQYFQLNVNLLNGGNFELINITDPVILAEGLPITVFSNVNIIDSTYTMYIEYTTNSASASGGPTQMTLYPFTIELRSIDSSYYHYLRSLYLYERSLYRSWIGEVYSPYPLYSNISEGYGIVAAYSKNVSDTIFPQR